MRPSRPLLYFEVHGQQGPYLLLVHGFLSSRAHWLLNIDALSAFCRPVIVELLGHARSPSPDDPARYSPDAYVAKFEAIRKSLGAERWLICGQSLGAALTLRYALDHPQRVIAQVFTNSNSALAGRDWATRVMPVMEAQARQLEREGHAALDSHPFRPTRSRRIPPEAKQALIADYKLHNPLGIARTARYTIPFSSVRERIAVNTVPTLLVAGEREESFRDQSRFAESAVPHISVLRLNAGHAVNLEAAAEFNAAVLTFFEALALN
ncbi:MAG TPA: alpha/beta hydrolase [Dehalococcoidia bacterium]|jgi:pimeloyl-ACP methyl ester carboxylesterase|nr:alpha/beta hydrolase [Dehalococcoidia bacterium]